MNKFSFAFYLNEAKWQQVGAICRSPQRQHGNVNLKCKPHISLYGAEREFAKPAFDSCRDLYPPSATATCWHSPVTCTFTLQIKETALHSWRQVWYSLTAFIFLPDQCTQLLVF